MGTKPRMLGADAVLRGITESAYGTSPTTGYYSLFYGANALDSEQPLGYDPILGQGRSGLDPFYDALDVSGEITIPLDVRAIGFWLHGLMGTPETTEVSATGTITFSAQPANLSTITLNGFVWTFVTGAPAAAQTQIGITLAATITALAGNLNLSANAEVEKCTYLDTATALNITHDAVGTTGNAFTIAASATSNGTRSAATLLGGGYSHVFTAGDDIPSKTIEVGHPELSSPVFFRYAGVVCGSLTFDMQRRGPANGRISAIAQGRTSATATIDSGATAYTLDRFSQGNGSIKLSGAQLAYVTAGTFTFTNNITAVETIRADGKIDGVDAGEARSTGSVTVRAGTDTALRNASDNQTPVVFQYSYTTPVRWALTIDLPRVFLPKVKQSITGPAGVEQTFDWQASKDISAGYNTRITLLNDVATYT